MTVKTFNPKQTTTLETPKKVIEELSNSDKKPLKQLVLIGLVV
jgi:hypothetical protein